MRRNILAVSFLRVQLIFLIVSSSMLELNAQEFYIRTLKCYSSNVQTSFPIIDQNDPERQFINIEFDILGSSIPNLSIYFRFCDLDWKPYDNAFLLNPVYSTERNLYFERLPTTVKGAHYHYSGTFPNQNVTFPFSGKWKYFIVDSQNKDIVFASGKFYVITPNVKLKVDILKERLEGSIPDDPSLGRTIAIRTSLILPDSLFQSQLKAVEIIENRKLYEPIIVDRQNSNIDRFYEWNGSNRFSFTARQLKPGNEYRQTDFRNIDRFPQENINAQYLGVETSAFFKRNPPDFNGGSLLSDFRDRYSDYLTVNFKLRPPENITSPIFLVGAFTDWKVKPEFEMFDDNGLMNIAVQLKRGVYDYQYVTADYINGMVTNIDWNILEGNFWETQNEYNIFLIYESTEKGGYDQIIGYEIVKSGLSWNN